ncbi:NADAR family protein [Chamaesiphon sp. OTE_8_metabat_110]|uniref:NADAR family protein n=1 Tax=Chamaesiphon sp. OTE_8_metabat_110 TaxID=2964696 RepID=UPI00286A70FF|nr:NADAR family protein [Chamaesiphon sp. OTE_8_metabat_110]
MTIYFYTDRETPYGCFSNFSKHGFVMDKLWWYTTEHYFQAQKFINTPYLEQIRSIRTPNDAAKMGRKRTLPLRSDWEQVKDEIMLRAVLCKFQIHLDLREILLGTGDEEIVENAPNDYYWGCGKDGTGKNQLGLTLMQVRETLRNN